ncbi:hypothetical protein ACEPAI_4228 [Sanghuangporus weigelae]
MSDSLLPPNRRRRVAIVWFDSVCPANPKDPLVNRSNAWRFIKLIKKNQPLVTVHKATSTSFSKRLEKRLLDWRRSGGGRVDESMWKVLDGYLHLRSEYKRYKDEISDIAICLLGAGEGARYARILAGMLHKLGLLHTTIAMRTAYLQYRSSDPEIIEECKEFHSFDVKVAFLGLWDCVGNVSFWPKKPFPYEIYNPSVEYVRHAVAADERRVDYIPALCSEDSADSTNVREVQFDGEHTDVAYARGTTLSDEPLAWMIQQFNERFPWVEFTTNVVPRPLPPPSDAAEASRNASVFRSSSVSSEFGSDDNNGDGQDVMWRFSTHRARPNDVSLLSTDAHLKKTEWLSELWPRVVTTSKGGEPRRRVIVNRGRKRDLDVYAIPPYEDAAGEQSA